MKNKKYYRSDYDYRIVHDKHFYSWIDEENEKHIQSLILRRVNVSLFLSKDTKIAEEYVKNMLYLRKAKAIQDLVNKKTKRFTYKVNPTIYDKAVFEEEISDYKNLLHDDSSTFGYLCTPLYVSDYCKGNNFDIDNYDDRETMIKKLTDTIFEMMKPEINSYTKTWTEIDEKGNKIEHLEQWETKTPPKNIIIAGYLNQKEREYMIATLRKRAEKEMIRCYYTTLLMEDAKEENKTFPSENWNELVELDKNNKVYRKIIYKESFY